MATLTERYTAQVNLGGVDHVVSWSKTATVTNLIDQILSVGTTEVTLFSDGASVSGATLTDFTYVWIENRDAANYLEVGIKETGSADVAYFRILAGQMFLLKSPQFSAGGAGEAIGSAAAIVTVTARFNTGAGLLRIVAGDDA